MAKDTSTQNSKLNRLPFAANAAIKIVFGILALLCVVPFLFVIVISFTGETAIAKNGYSLFPSEFSLEAYRFLWSNKNMIFDSTKVSLIVTVVGTIFGTILTTSMGYVLSRKEYKLHKFFTWVVFIPMVFNGGLISTYFMTKTVYGLGDTYWALILPLMVSSFNVIISRTYFQMSIPDSIIESAKIDGATQFRIFFGIIIPISLPLLATIGLFLSFGYWNDWWQAMLYITKTNMRPLQSLLNSIERNVEYILNNAGSLGVSQSEMLQNLPRQSFRMAIAVVIILPISLAYPFFQRYFISGLTIGAVKG